MNWQSLGIVELRELIISLFCWLPQIVTHQCCFASQKQTSPAQYRGSPGGVVELVGFEAVEFVEVVGGGFDEGDGASFSDDEELAVEPDF